MRFAFALVMVASLVSLLAGEAAAVKNRSSAAQRPAAVSRAILGTWQLVWPEKPADEREIKLITPTHFTWTSWNTGTHRVLASGGGSYTLVGENYCEQLLFAQGYVESAAGRVLCFDVQVKGDTLLQIGPQAADGGRSREVWKRLR